MGEPVYLGYDQEALDLQYDNRQRIANSQEAIARFTRDSADVRARLPNHGDISYGESEPERLDIFTTSKVDGPAPVQVFFHGGYWRQLDAHDFHCVVPAFVAAGAVCVVVNYALIPAVDMGELLRQCRAALLWVGDNIAAYGGDPARIFISGHSAGGHIVGAILAPNPIAGMGETAPLVAGAVAISGLYDLEPMRRCFLQEVIALSADDVRRHSPINSPPEKPLPLVLAYGAEESEEYARQTDAYAAVLRGNGITCEVRPIAGANHMTVASALSDGNSEMAQIIIGQMGLGSRDVAL